MNGAGAGGRLVARRESGTNNVPTSNYGRSQLGSREQRRQDLRMAFRVAGGAVG
ncbi:MAG: hypothetical protein HDR88_10250 [Bacteroides sp.]|nr:hypothetical protein [Bacteroides sp.]